MAFDPYLTTSSRIDAGRLDLARGIRAPRVSVVIPALNEAANLPWVLARLPVEVHEVVLVDGGSTDDTVEVARTGHASIKVIGQKEPGKGAALVTGLLAARGDIVVMIDADGSMDPAEIPALVGALLAGADVAKGSRYVVGGGSDDITRLRGVGNRLLTWAGRLLYRQRWSELCYGYAAFWTNALEGLGLDELLPHHAASLEEELAELSAPVRRPVRYGHGFEIEAVLFTRAARSGMRVTEVASWEHPRRYGASNLSTFRDGWRVLTALVRERGRPPTPVAVIPAQATPHAGTVEVDRVIA